jgi:hypothetical protein
MTIEQWNQLQPGDYICHIKDPTLIYRIHALTSDEEWQDEDERGRGIITISHQIWIDPLLPHDDPYYPDICPYDPGECDRFLPVSADDPWVKEALLHPRKIMHDEQGPEEGQPEARALYYDCLSERLLDALTRYLKRVQDEEHNQTLTPDMVKLMAGSAFIGLVAPSDPGLSNDQLAAAWKVFSAPLQDQGSPEYAQAKELLKVWYNRVDKILFPDEPGRRFS